jgi:hypothetical protein
MKLIYGNNIIGSLNILCLSTLKYYTS